MSEYDTPDPFIPLDRIRNCILSDTGLNSFTKIYCACGRIVDVDTSDFRRKQRLQKAIECPFCRNVRIGRELDRLDVHYNVMEEVQLH